MPGTKLIIVESPAKAKTLAKFLGKGYRVEASQGHVRDLPKSQLGIDVDHDFAMKYITIHGRGEILARIRKEAKTSTQIYLATDPDREGEAISWHLAQLLNMDLDTACRIEFHEVTKKAVTQALKNPRKVNMELVDAQQARRALDRLVGYQISPILWKKIKKGLSAGRVQSAAMRMVVEREKEIDAFLPDEFWEVTAECAMPADSRRHPVKARLLAVDGAKADIKNAEAAEAVKARILQGEWTVASVKKGEKKKSPTPPFTTSTLQQEASRKLNFTTQRTMQVVQQLYEGVDLGKQGTQGIVTYIRTDSVNISEEAMEQVRAYIGTTYGAEYLPAQPVVYKGRSNAQNAHEAIRPTDANREPDSIKQYLTREQYMLYRLIYQRFVASQMTNAAYDTVTVDLKAGNLSLRYYGEHKVFAGFTCLYEEGADEAAEKTQTEIPDIAEGTPVKVKDVHCTQHFTQPPARYTEATLVRAMEENGIGRPSTYAPTITTLVTRGYITRESKRLFPSELGMMVDEAMTAFFHPIVDIDFTAHLESQLDAVEAGEVAWKQVLRDFYPSFHQMLEAAESGMEKKEIKPEVSDVPCDKCGTLMVYRVGRFGKFLACPNFPDCRNTKPILNYIGVPCPKCGGQLMEKTSRKNRRFYGCERYPECDFVSWDKPTEKRCPKCGSYMVLKSGGKRGSTYLCANESCRTRLDAEEGDAE